MKLKEPTRLSRRRALKASELLQSPEAENDAKFDPERDLGEAFRLEILQRAEEFLQQPAPAAPRTEDWPFGDLPQEREPSHSIEFLAAHKILFPQYQAELEILMQKYKVKEEVLAKDEGGAQFLEKMVLAPEMKQVFVQQADTLIRRSSTFGTGVGMGSELLLVNAAQMVSVKPELFGKLGLRGMKKDFFDLLARKYQDKEWNLLIRYAACARLLFPNDFDSSFLKPDDWEHMRQEARYPSGPFIAVYLAIMSADEVHFLPEGEVRITWPSPRLKSKPELPPRQHV